MKNDNCMDRKLVMKVGHNTEITKKNYLHNISKHKQWNTLSKYTLAFKYYLLSFLAVGVQNTLVVDNFSSLRKVIVKQSLKKPKIFFS